MPRTVCPTCGAEYDGDRQTCDLDGSPLHPIASPPPTPARGAGGVGTLVGSVVTREEAEAQRAQQRSFTPRDAPRPSQPTASPAVAASARSRNLVPILIGALVVIAGVLLIALSMRR